MKKDSRVDTYIKTPGNTNLQRDTLHEKAFINLVKAVAKNNRAGGWRKLQKNNE